MFNRSARVALFLLVAVPAAVAVVSLGLVVVWGGGEEVLAAELTNHVDRQQLTRLPGGAFIGVPALEGTVRIRCRSGATAEWGYASPGVPLLLNLSERRLCSGHVRDHPLRTLLSAP